MRSKHSAKRARGSSSARAETSHQVAPELAAERSIRERLAYELHDGVCQELAAINFLLSPVLATARRIDPGLTGHLEYVAQRVAATLEAARALALDWAGPSTPCEANLQQALEAEARALRTVHDVDIGIDASIVARCPPDTEAVAQLCKIAREAIHNAIRHGKARHVEVELRDLGIRWGLEICSDGAGNFAGAPRWDGLGIRSMRHRAKRLDGTLEISRRTSRGLRVLVCWPKVRATECANRERP
ncbi:MAG TPA: histidine kinase [Steroidobacteraceae bacterium]|nr:histidine kinase [Steroidobacteraceae bacterium]